MRRCLRPTIAVPSAAAAGFGPGGADRVRHLEGRRRPAERRLGARELLHPERLAVRLRGARLLGRAEADGGLAGDQRRAVGRLRLGERGVDRVRVVAVNARGAPAIGLEALHLVGRVGERQRAVDRDAVVVPQDDQAAELQMPGERGRLVADALHEVAVGGEHVGVVVDGLVAELGVEDALREREPDRRGDALAERPGRRLDPGRHEALRVARRLRVELAEALQLVDRDALDAREVEERVEQHRAVPGRQHEAVAVEPVRVGGVVLEVPGEEDGRHVGGAHRQPGMARLRLLDGVHRQRPHGIRQIGMGRAIGAGAGGHEVSDPNGEDSWRHGLLKPRPTRESIPAGRPGRLPGAATTP
jgi:hypothetical protein